MAANPLLPEILFYLGPVPVSRPVVTTWVIMAVLVAGCWLILRRPHIRAGLGQGAIEIVVETIAVQVRDVIGRDPWPYVPLLGTLFMFLVVANLSAIVPGTQPPTGHLETPAALAVIVFVSVHFFGIRSRGFGNYIRHYLQPNPFMLPLNILSEITRTFALMVRLFGNMMSHELVIAIVLLLAGLLLPIPFMLLGILIGIIQAYIFTVLATVFIGAGIGSVEAA